MEVTKETPLIMIMRLLAGCVLCVMYIYRVQLQLVL